MMSEIREITALRTIKAEYSQGGINPMEKETNGEGCAQLHLGVRR